MTYKETLFFIGKCLTINHEKHNYILVEKKLKSDKIDWNSVVKVSTSHYVFPALYCNLKKAELLNYLPNDLVEYMKHITDLNRERNQHIIAQAKEINELLLANNITPIFLKGTGNLLEGLYEDIAERMVGDIDFIFSQEDYTKAIEVLTSFGYSKVIKTKYDFPSFKHYPRLNKKGKIAAVEIHKELLLEEFASEFNFKIIVKDFQKIHGVSVMSFSNQLSLSIIAKQINNDGFYYKNIALRNAYDVFLLSKKTTAINAFDNFNTLKKPLNCFLATCHELFNKPESLNYLKTESTQKYLSDFYKYLSDENLQKKHFKKTSLNRFWRKRFGIIYKSFFDKAHRAWLIKRIADKDWHNQKLIQLGLKKPKPNS